MYKLTFNKHTPRLYKHLNNQCLTIYQTLTPSKIRLGHTYYIKAYSVQLLLESIQLNCLGKGSSGTFGLVDGADKSGAKGS